MATLYAFDDTSQLTDSLGQYVRQACSTAIAARARFTIALSGGSLAKFMASSIVHDESMDWSKWHVFFADERIVPLDHEDSNYRLQYDEFLSKTQIPREQIYCIDPALDPQDVADDYEAKLVKVFASRETVKLPIFDLILLGCGPDGHTCSLFPDHDILREDSAWVGLVEDSPKPPPLRITLTMKVVVAAHSLAFVATGSSKQSILRAIFDDVDCVLPCALINRESKSRCSWFCDAEAVKQVQYDVKHKLKL